MSSRGRISARGVIRGRRDEVQIKSKKDAPRSTCTDSVTHDGTFVKFVAFSNNTGSLVADEDINADSAATKAYFIAKDSAAQLFNLTLWTYKETTANPVKLFPVKDPVAGIATLRKDAVQGNVTGEQVTNCYLVPLMLPMEAYGSLWNNKGR